MKFLTSTVDSLVFVVCRRRADGVMSKFSQALGCCIYVSVVVHAHARIHTHARETAPNPPRGSKAGLLEAVRWEL